MDRSQHKGSVDLEVARKQGFGSLSPGLVTIHGVENSQIDYSRDGSAKPNQLLSVDTIGSPEVVDNLGHRLAGDGVTLVVGQLEIFDD